MSRIRIVLCALAVAALGFLAAASAATKTYQFTGVVKTVDATTFSVEKSAKETWTFEKAPDTKGTPKVGDKVTVMYKMVATSVETKPAAATKK
jgi:hypothetical protein